MLGRYAWYHASHTLCPPNMSLLSEVLDFQGLCSWGHIEASDPKCVCFHSVSQQMLADGQLSAREELGSLWHLRSDTPDPSNVAL